VSAATLAATRRHPFARWFHRRISTGTPRALAGRVSPSFDQLAKEILDLLLSARGRVETEAEVPSLATQRVDVYFEPDPDHDEARRALGLLGRMSDRSCFFEAFHEAPDVAEVTACLRKLLNHRHARELANRSPAERAWLLCGGRPDAALRAFRATPTKGWEPGIYDLGDAMPVSLVVLSELPETEDTLPLRLMGAGKTLRRSVAALRESPPGEVRDALLLRMVERHIERRVRGVQTPGEAEEEEAMKGFPLVEEMKRAARIEGLTEGLTKGILEGLTKGRTEGAHLALGRYVERTLGRTLSVDEDDVLRRRLILRGDRVLDEVFGLDAAALDAWLSRRDD